jgi:hypothetical protein
LTLREVVGAAVGLARRSIGIRLLGLFMVAITGIAALAGDRFSLIGLVIGLAIVSGWALAPFAWWQFRKRPDLVGGDTNLIADENGIEIDSPLSQGRTAWSMFRKAHDLGACLVFDTAVGSIMIVPKRAFSPSQLGVMYRLLDRQGLLPAPAQR